MYHRACRSLYIRGRRGLPPHREETPGDVGGRSSPGLLTVAGAGTGPPDSGPRGGHTRPARTEPDSLEEPLRSDAGSHGRRGSASPLSSVSERSNDPRTPPVFAPRRGSREPSCEEVPSMPLGRGSEPLRLLRSLDQQKTARKNAESWAAPALFVVKTCTPVAMLARWAAVIWPTTTPVVGPPSVAW